jgi:glycerol-3-phosphate acyltransferase PlsY
MMIFSGLLAFFLGSLPLSWILVWMMRGVDLRKIGSGNPGATNAMRVMGPRWGVLALLLDITKGTLAVRIPMLLIPMAPDWFPVVCGLLALLGNIFCPFLRFKGGKGVATATGVFLGLAPAAVGLTLVLFGLLLAASKKVSLGSLVGALILPILLTLEWHYQAFDQPSLWIIVLAWSTGVMVIIRHRENIRRLISGKERSILEKVSISQDTQ